MNISVAGLRQKEWVKIIVLIVLAGFILRAILNFNFLFETVQSRFFATPAQKEAKRLEELYKNDTIGGKTPEETFDLFIKALKEDNLELASKYFVLNKQDDWEKTLNEYKENVLIVDLITELEKNKQDWRKNDSGNGVVEFYSTVVVNQDFVEFKGQKIPVEKGEYTNTTRFEKYPSGIWKISLL